MGIQSVSDTTGEQMVENLRASPVLMSADDLLEFDRRVQADEDGPTRRAALLIFTQSGAEFLDQMAADDKLAVAYAELSRCIAGYVGRLKQLIELMECVKARLMVGLATREDITEILAMAEKPEVCQ